MNRRLTTSAVCIKTIVRTICTIKTSIITCLSTAGRGLNNEFFFLWHINLLLMKVKFTIFELFVKIGTVLRFFTSIVKFGLLYIPYYNDWYH